MDRILGQSRAIETLQAILNSGRMHHAWILSGPPGVGKCTTALDLARILLDDDARPGEDGRYHVDPESRAARLIEAGTHPDLHLIYRELARYSSNDAMRDRKLMNIPLDLLRERMLGGKTGDGRAHDAPAYRTPFESSRKVFIIDEAELIDRLGQNALLKTLEEPPTETYIFLVTSRPELLLPTITSRCHHVRFGRLDEAAMSRWFERSAPDLAPARRRWIEWFAEGSPGAVVLAAEYGLDDWREVIDPMLAALESGQFPPDAGEALGKLTNQFAETWVKRHDNASKDAANKAGVRHLLTILARHCRDRLEECCADGADPAPWPQVIDLLRRTEQYLDGNVNMKQALENLVVQWAAIGANAGRVPA